MFSDKGDLISRKNQHTLFNLTDLPLELGDGDNKIL